MALAPSGAIIKLISIVVVLVGCAAPAPGAARQAEMPAEPLATLTLTTVASSAVPVDSSGGPLVWYVRRDPPPGEDLPLRAVLAARELPRMHGEHGAFRRSAAPDRQARLRAGQAMPLGGAAIDTLAVGVALRPVATLAAALPAGALISEPFAAPQPSGARLELRQGTLAPGMSAALPASGTPALVLAVDRPLQLAARAGAAAPVVLGRGEMALATPGSALFNPGRRPATVLVALVAPRQNPTAPLTPAALAAPDAMPAATDPALDAAWSRFGCPLNPGNPSCLAVGLAAACQRDSSTTGCAADSDGDRCLDTAEVRTNLDPYDAADCLGSPDGKPLLNCLFPAALAACDGSQPPGPAACGAMPDPRRAAHPGAGGGCLPPAEDADVGIDCGPRERDPACDGFAPTSP